MFPEDGTTVGGSTAPATSADSAAAASTGTTTGTAAPATSGESTATSSAATVSAPATPADSADALAPRAGETAEAYVARLKDGGVEIKRTADAQRAMHDATGKVADLRKKLDAIFGHPTLGPEATKVAGTPALGDAATPAPTAARPVDVRPAAAPALTDAALEDLFTKYRDPALDEKAAFKLLITEVAKIVSPQIDEAKLLDRAYSHVIGKSREAVRAESVVSTVEKFWQESAPHIPAEHIWLYAGEAQRTHPNEPDKQALYCLNKALAAFGSAGTRASETRDQNATMTRAATASIPGGGAAPGAGVTTDEKVLSFADQVKANKSRDPNQRL